MKETCSVALEGSSPVSENKIMQFAAAKVESLVESHAVPTPIHSISEESSVLSNSSMWTENQN